MLAVLLAAGCGGGGGSVNTGNVVPTPSPAPTATHTPGSTPTPTPTPHGSPTPTPAPTPTPTAHGTPTPVPTPTPTATATTAPTQAPGGTPTPIPGTSIITDTNPATSGVFIGDTCASSLNDSKCVLNYASTYRHSLSFYVSFTDWNTSLASFISSENMASWQALNVTPLITWDPIGVSYTDVLAGKWDAYITASAQAVKAFSGTIFMRPFHEFNGKYTSYGLANQGADTTADTNFIATWQHMVNIFRQQGVTNVRWVWCYANRSVPSDTTNPWNDPANAYPGDAYVDWVAFDAFNRGNEQQGIVWQTFDQLISASYTKAVGISATRPVMISELGSNEWGDGGARKAQWIASVLTELPATYPHLRAVGYFDLSNPDFSYGLQSTLPAYNAWFMGLRTVSASGVINFRGTGVPLDGLTAWQ